MLWIVAIDLNFRIILLSFLLLLKIRSPIFLKFVTIPFQLFVWLSFLIKMRMRCKGRFLIESRLTLPEGKVQSSLHSSTSLTNRTSRELDFPGKIDVNK